MVKKDTVRILYNGKDLKTLEKAKVSDEEKLLTQAMVLNVEAALEPLKGEIEDEGGGVTIDIQGPNVFQIATDDLSDKLIKKVRSALTP